MVETQRATLLPVSWAVRHHVSLAACGLLIIALAARMFNLDSMITVDGAAHWSHRIPDFWDGLATGDFKKTFQPHPGVTLMWFSGLSLKLAGVLHAGPAAKFIAPATLPIALFGALLAPATFLLLRRLLERKEWMIAFLSGLLLATEPLTVHTSRLLHVDNFAVGFGWLAVLCAAISFQERSWRFAVLAGLSQGLALLSRTSTGPIALGIAAYWIVLFARSRGKDHALTRLLSIIAASAGLTVVLFWPALLFEPAYVVQQMTEKTGIMLAKGHSLFFMGEIYEKDPGALYYAVLLWLRMAPETTIPLIGGIASAWWFPSHRRLLFRLGLMYAVFLIAITLTGKKTNRYIYPVLPLLCVVSAVGWSALLKVALSRSTRYIGQWTALVVSVLLLGRSARLADIHPLPSAWCAEYPGIRCEEWITLGGGQGLKEVALFIKSFHAQTRRDYPEVRRRAKVFPSPHVVVLSSWMKVDRARSVKNAYYLLDYLSERQRGWGATRLERFRGDQEPLFEVNLAGRNFARVYLGPKHPDYARRGGRDKQD